MSNRIATCVDCHWRGNMSECDKETISRSRETKDPVIHGYKPGREKPQPLRPGFVPVCPDCGGWVNTEKIENFL